jgi:hypothetical protein
LTQNSGALKYKYNKCHPEINSGSKKDSKEFCTNAKDRGMTNSTERG